MPDRRTFIKLLAATAAAPLANAQVDSETPSTPADITFAHFTDVHFGAELLDDGLPEGASVRGLTKTLQHAQSQNIAFIIQGGDWIAEAFNTTEEAVTTQWDGLSKVLDAELKVPLYHTIGNHDIWGFDLESSQTTGREPLWGKAWAMQEMGLISPYYAFSHGAWRFIVLDSIRRDEETDYRCELDREQFDWLEMQLTTHAYAPTVIVSHAPIVSVGAFFGGNNHITGDWNISRAAMHIDAVNLKGLFSQNPQVKLCLSGHLHLKDDVFYNGVHYACNGAVSGGTWYGKSQETSPGYGLVQLWNNGDAAVHYLTPELG